jgi:hypothetical protein
MLGGGAEISATGNVSNLRDIAILENAPASATSWSATGIIVNTLNATSDRLTAQAFVLCGS